MIFYFSVSRLEIEISTFKKNMPWENNNFYGINNFPMKN